jgi:phospholipid-binding lipoprotein MlaA
LSVLDFLPAKTSRVALWAVFGAALLTGCASRPDDDPAAAQAYDEANDPFEPTNRVLLDINLTLDRFIFKPVAYVYKETLPTEAQKSVTNVLNNMHAPVTFANDVLQGEPGRAGTIAARFAINTLIGFAGLFDVAHELGFQLHDEDFGQTLGVWGAQEGPYLMLPLFGPSNPRDGVGMFVDIFLDPFTYIFRVADIEWAGYVRLGVRGIDTRARHYDEFNELQRSSLDFYATLRSLYRQRRTDEINNGRPTAVEPGPRLSQPSVEPSTAAVPSTSQ